MRNSLFRASVAFAVSALAGPATAAPATAAPAASAQTETERVSRVVKIEPGGTLRLKSFSGHVVITGADRPDVAIEAVRRAPRERLERITLDIRTEGSTVVIDANHRDRSWWDWHGNNVVETDFDIKVPARTNVNVDVFSSSVDVRNVEGSHRIHTFSGRMRLEDVIGPIKADSFSGHVEIRTRDWQNDQRIEVGTFSGSIDLHVPPSAKGSVSFDTFSGRLTSEMPLTLRSSRRRSIDASLGGDSGGGSLRFKTFSGNVRIDR